MDELVYRFLLQSGFPRASIVTDLDLLPVAGADQGVERGAADGQPRYAVVDPVTGDRLAVIDAVGALDGDALGQSALQLAQYAQRFGGRAVQGFLVRVDPAAAGVDQQVQFYRVWPNESLQRVGARAFPDLDALRTRRLLADRAQAVVSIETVDDDAFDVTPGESGGGASGQRPGGAAWLPGLLILALALIDWSLARFTGDTLLSATQAVLAVGAAALLLWVAVARAGRG